MPGSALNRLRVTPAKTSSIGVALAHDRRAQAIDHQQGVARLLQLVLEGAAAVDDAEVLEHAAAALGGADRGQSVPVASAVRISTCSLAEIETMLAVTPVASAAGVRGVDPVAQVEQAVAGIDRDRLAVDREAAGQRERVVEGAADAGARHLVGGGDLLDLDAMAGRLRGVGDRDPEDVGRRGRRLAVAAAGGGEGLLGLEDVGAPIEADRAAQALDRALERTGQRVEVLPGGDLELVVRDPLLDPVDRHPLGGDDRVDRALDVDPAAQPGERDPAALVDGQAVEIETGRHLEVPSGALVDQGLAQRGVEPQQLLGWDLLDDLAGS